LWAASDSRSEDRELLENEADILVLRQDFFHVRQGPFAVAAIVVEELDDGHIAVRIAKGYVVFGRKQRVLVLLDCGGSLLEAGVVLLLFKGILHVQHDFRIGEEVFLDELAELLLLLVVEGIHRCRKRYRQHHERRGGEIFQLQGHVIPLVGCPPMRKAR